MQLDRTGRWGRCVQRRRSRGLAAAAMQRTQGAGLGAGVSRRWPAASGAWQGGDRGDELEEVLGRLGGLARGEVNAGEAAT